MNKTRKWFSFFSTPGVVLLGILCFLCGVLLLKENAAVALGVQQGLALCSGVVIPSLFPFLVLSGFLSCSRVSTVFSRILAPLTRYLFHLPAAAAAPLLLGFLGGYPVGARTLALQVANGHLSAKTAGRMLCFVVNAGPSFLLCAVGSTLFHSAFLGGLLLGAQALSACSIGVFLGFFAPASFEKELSHSSFAPVCTCFVQAVNGAASGMMSICAFVLVFSAFSSLLSATGFSAALGQGAARLFPGIAPSFFEAILLAVFEVTNGCRALSAFGANGLLAASALLSFSGFSVIFQVLAAIHGSKISSRPFLLSRIVHSALTFFFFNCLLSFFPQAIPVFSTCAQAPIAAISSSGSACVSMLFMCVVFLLTLRPLYVK